MVGIARALRRGNRLSPGLAAQEFTPTSLEVSVSALADLAREGFAAWYHHAMPWRVFVLQLFSLGRVRRILSQSSVRQQRNLAAQERG